MAKLEEDNNSGQIKTVTTTSRGKMVLIVFAVAAALGLLIWWLISRVNRPAALGSSIAPAASFEGEALNNSAANKEYIRLQVKENQESVRKAIATGGSAIPVLINTTGADNFNQIADDSGISNVSAKGCGTEELRRAKVAGVKAEELRCRGCSLQALKAAGFSAAELVNAGFTAKELLDGGYSVAELREAGVSCTDLVAAGADPKELIAAGATVGELLAAGASAASLMKAGVSLEQLVNAGATVEELKAAGVSIEEMKKLGLPVNAGSKQCKVENLRKLRTSGKINVAKLKDLGCDIASLKAAGFSASDLKKAGYSAGQLRRGGFSASELKQVGFGAKELREGGFGADELVKAGYPASELLQAGYNVADLKKAGTPINELLKLASPEALRKAGFSAEELLAAGVSEEALSSAGFSAGDIMRAGSSSVENVSTKLRGQCSPAFVAKARREGTSVSELRRGGCSAKELVAAGVGIQELKVAGFGAKELLDAGVSARDLARTGFKAKELLDAGASVQDLVRAGFKQDEINRALLSSSDKQCSVDNLKRLRNQNTSLREIKKLACSAKQLADAGFSVQEMLAAGFKPKDLLDAGANIKELLDAGVSVKELLDAGVSAKELTKNGVSAAKLLKAGLKAKELVAAGVSAKELVAAGVSARELVAAGISAKELEGAGITRETLAELDSLANEEVMDALNSEEKSSYEELVGGRTNLTAAEQQQLLSGMMTQASQLFSSWNPVAKQQFVQGENASASSGMVAPSNVGSATISAPNQVEGSNSGMVVASSEVFKAGSIIFGVLDTSVNSDESTPVLATIVQGPLKGGKLLGNFRRVDKHVLIQFSVLNLPYLRNSIALNAVAIDPDTARTALASDVNNHYLLRYGTVLAASFLEGLGDALHDSGSRIETTLSGTLATFPDLTWKEKFLEALGTTARKISSMNSSVINTPPTIKVNAGTGIGILFMADLTVPEPDMETPRK